MPIGNPIRKQNESRMVSVLATEGQTVFTVQGGYIINHISVFRNGVRLSHADDYTAGDGSTVTLNEGTNVNDRIDFHIFDRFTVQNAIIGAASTQTINGDLVLNGKLFGALDVPSINLTGIVTATELDLNGKGNISSDLTIERHLNVTGISTFKDKVHLLDSDKLHIGGAAGDNGDLQLFHDGSNSYIEDSGTGNLFIESNSSVQLRDNTGNVDFAKFINGGGVELYHNNVERLTTTYTGADVTGTLNVTGVSTFTGDVNFGDATSDTVTFTARVDSDLSPSGSTRDLGTTGVEWRNLYTSSGVIASDTISSHASDSDTKIRFPTVDTVSVETAGTERVRINSSGLIGIGTNNPLNSAAGARVNIYFKDETTYDSTTNRANGLIIHNTASGGYSSLELAQRTTSGNTYGSAIINAVDPSNGNQYGADLTFQTRATGSGNYGERMRITAAGQILIGTATARAVGGESNPRLHIEGSGNTSNSWVNITRFQAGTGAPNLQFGKARSNTAGTYTIVQDDDNLGQISFLGADGSDLANYAAVIRAQVDGSPASNNIPGRLVFQTASGGTNSEKMRITSDGRILINTTAVTNTNDQLTVKRPAGSWTEMSLTLDATTTTGSAANALMFTKSKHTYWNGYAFQSSHGYIGALLGKRDSAGTSDQEIRLEIGGDSPNQNEEKTWTFRNSGNLALSGGNIEFASGYGIDFSATGNSSGSMASELFDDYEEGTWTPSLTFGGGSTGISYGSRSGSYIKIGTMCYVQGQLDLTSKGSSTGDAAFDSLPFTVGDYVSGTSQEGSGFITWWSNTGQSDFAPAVFWISQGTTTATIYRTNDGSNIQTHTHSQWANNTAIRFFAQYRTT